MMPESSRRLSSLELSQKILEMGKTGVYRESVFEALRPYATKKQIREAIAHAKHGGLHSVPKLRDADLGTYYQVDLAQYQQWQPALQEALPLMAAGDLAQQMLETRRSLERMVNLAGLFWMGLAIAGCLCLFGGWSRLGFGSLGGAASVALMWGVQRQWLQRKVNQ